MHNNIHPLIAAIQWFLMAYDVSVLDWPAKNPSFNPIEHMWDELGHHVRTDHAINRVNDLAATLQIEWGNYIQHYVNSMHRQIMTCTG